MPDFGDLLNSLPESGITDDNTADSSSETATDQVADPKTPPEEPKTPPADPKDPAKDQKVPFHKHPRFVNLNNSYQKAQADNVAKDARIKELEELVANGGKQPESKDLADMTAEEYNDHIMSEARRIAKEEASKYAPPPKKSTDEAQQEIYAQIDQEFATIRDLNDEFTDDDEEAVIALCMKPPEELQKVLGDRNVATIKEGYRYYMKSGKATAISPEKRKNAEVKTGTGTGAGGNSEYKFQSNDDIRKAGQRIFGGSR